MSGKDYKIIEKRLEELDLTLMIVVIPTSEMEDKLAVLAREGGALSKNFYEDFVMTVCVANINKVLYSFNQYLNLNTDIKMSEVRKQIYSFVIEANPLLSPDFIYINKNGILKIDKTGKKKLSIDELWLSKNKMWNVDNYEDVIDGISKCKEDCTCSIDSEEDTKVEVPKKKQKLDSTELIPVASLPYEEIKKWWNRLSKYVEIKKFRGEDAEHLLRSGEFNSRSIFNSHIVSLCVKDVRALFEFLDSIGITAKISPPILMYELYDLCKQVNPFLVFEDAIALTDEPCKEISEDKKRKKKTGLSMSEYAKDSKQKKRFKDVPKKDLISLGARLKEKLIGQDDAVDSLVESIQRAGVGLKDPEKPIGSFLFAGSTGCGKSLTGKLLSKELVKDNESFIVVDCSEYSADHEYSKLIGSAPGYVGFEQGGYLTNAISKNPFSIVVFDEVEKASYKVHELLLQVLDEGRLTDGKGGTVSFKDAIIIMTSNIGAKEVDGIKNTVGFGDVATITDKKKDIEIAKAIKNKFKPEFINRIDSIIYFKKLSKKDYIKIIELELEKLNGYLKHNDTDYKESVLFFDDKVKNLIFKEGIDEDFGARPLKRCIEKLIATPLALKMLREDINFNSNIIVSAVGSSAAFEIEDKLLLIEENKKKEVGDGC